MQAACLLLSLLLQSPRVVIKIVLTPWMPFTYSLYLTRFTMLGKRHVAFASGAPQEEQKNYLNDHPITLYNQAGSSARVAKVRNDMKHGLKEGWVTAPDGTGDE